jgi:hypothetical protein
MDKSWTDESSTKVQQTSDEKSNDGGTMDSTTNATASQSALEIHSDGGCDVMATAL